MAKLAPRSLLSAIMLAMMPCQSVVAVEDVCFRDGQKPAVEIMQQAPPPRLNDQKTYRFFPATANATSNIAALDSTKADRTLLYWQWANHGPRRHNKSNVAAWLRQIERGGIYFSTSESADACTMAQTAMLLGDVATGASFARGLVTLVSDFGVGDAHDLCPKPPPLPQQTDGILLDYEVADGRTPDHTLTFLSNYAAYVKSHGKKVVLYTNALNAPSQRLTSVNGSNAETLVRKFDLVSILIRGSQTPLAIKDSFKTQIEMVGTAPKTHLYIVFDLKDASLAGAETVRSLMTENNIGVLNLWRNGTALGGSCENGTNRVIACLAFGKCRS